MSRVHERVLVINGLFLVVAGYGVEVVMVGVVSGGGSSEGRRPRGAAPHSSSSSSRAHKSRWSPFPRPLGLATLVLVLAAFARAEQGKKHARHSSLFTFHPLPRGPHASPRRAVV